MYFVYALCDPRDDSIAYIGITDNLYSRFKTHLSMEGKQHRKTSWISLLKAEKLIPSIKVIETVKTVQEAENREYYWVHYYLNLGVKLKNFAKTDTGMTPNVPIATEEDGELLTLKAVANKLGYHPEYVRMLVKTDKLPGVLSANARLTKSVLMVRALDVERFTAEREANNAKPRSFSRILRERKSGPKANEYNLTEVARRLGISRTYVYQLVRSGEIKTVCSAPILVLDSDLEEFIAKRQELRRKQEIKREALKSTVKRIAS